MSIQNYIDYTETSLEANSSSNLALHNFSLKYLRDCVHPIGSIIQWEDFDGKVTIPDGFMLCDGSTLNNSDSPIDGETLPNLNGGSDTFIIRVI